MEKKYFPMFVDISDKKVVVIGGGGVGTRRVETLLHFTAHIMVVAPELSSRLRELSEEGRIQWMCRGYEPGDIKAADIVLAATDNREVNCSIGEECRCIEAASGRKVLFNTADDKTLCDFYFPAVVETDGLMIGINSSGKNPAKVKQLRESLEKDFV